MAQNHNRNASLRIKACSNMPLHQMIPTCLYALASLAVLLACVIMPKLSMLLMLTMMMLTSPGLLTLQASPWGGPPRPSGGDSLTGSSGAARHQLSTAPG